MEKIQGIERKKMLHVISIPPKTRLPPTRGSMLLNMKILRQLHVPTGGLLSISSRAVGTAWPSAKLSENDIYIDAILSENAEIRVGDTVEISRVEQAFIAEAEEIKLKELQSSHSTYETPTFIIGRSLENMSPEILQAICCQQLFGLYVVVGQRISMSFYGMVTSFLVGDIKASEASTVVSKVLLNSSYSSELFLVGKSTRFLVESLKKGSQFSLQNETCVSPCSSSAPLGTSISEFSNPFAFPTSSSESIGGLPEQLCIVQEMVNLSFHYGELLGSYGQKAPKGVILYGPPGTGKTLMARVIARKCGAKVFVINGPEFVSSYVGESEAKLRELFKQAVLVSPSLVFIDELDAICGNRVSTNNEMERRIVGTLLTVLDGIRPSSKVFVIGATNRLDTLDPALRRPGRFDKEVEIGIPNVNARLEILSVYLRRMPNSLTEEDKTEIASTTHGYVGADLASICREAGLNTIKRVCSEAKSFHPPVDNFVVSKQDMLDAMSKIVPSAMRELVIEVPKVHWEDIGGYENLKQSLKDLVELPIKHPEVFKRMGIDPPKGILLYGPPGCSKTLMAKAVATEAEINFIAIKGPELFSKFIGESERAVRDLFRKARAASPSIIFFDEIDALASSTFSSSSDSGNSGESSVSERVIGQLLGELNGIASVPGVRIIAATNRPDRIHKSLLSSSRFDRVLFVPPPDLKAREEIFRVRLKMLPHEDDINALELAKRTEHFSGAEITAICREASMIALEEDIECKFIRKSHFYTAIGNIRPVITLDMLDFYEKWQISREKQHKMTMIQNLQEKPTKYEQEEKNRDNLQPPK